MVSYYFFVATKTPQWKENEIGTRREKLASAPKYEVYEYFVNKTHK